MQAMIAIVHRICEDTFPKLSMWLMKAETLQIAALLSGAHG